MKGDLLKEVKSIITVTVGSSIVPNPLRDDYPLVGNLLDSLAVTNLIVALEEHFGFVFHDDELSAEAFENAVSLANLVAAKIEA
jgi:acyl carrier protein